MSDTLPENFGQFVIDSLLGESPLGHTYLAHHQYLDLQVAIKVLDKVTLKKDEVDSLARSARLLMTIIHPSVNRLHDFGVQENAVYYAYAYVERGTLRDTYPQGYKVPEKKVASLIKQLAEGLHILHEKGIMHGNLSFNNILVDAENQACITDIGIVPLLSVKNTNAYQQWVNPQQMAPELFEASSKASKASDIYSVGTIVYELLTGQEAYAGSYAQVKALHQKMVIPILNSRQMHFSQQVHDAVIKSMSHGRNQRQASINAFANDLIQYACVDEGFLDENENDDAPIRFPRGTTRNVHSHKHAILNLAWAPNSLSIASISDKHTPYNGDEKYNLHVWNCETGTVEHQFDENSPNGGISWNYNGSAIISTGGSKKISKWDLDSGELTQYINSPQDEYVNKLVLSPNKQHGALLIGGYYDDNLYFFDVSEFKVLPAPHMKVQGIVWGHDNKMVAMSIDNRIHLWDYEKQRTILWFIEYEESVSYIAFSPDGSKVVSVGDLNKLFVWSPKKGTIIKSRMSNDDMVERIAKAHDDEGVTMPLIKHVTWMPDNERVVYTIDGGSDGYYEVRIWNTTTDEIEFVYIKHKSHITALTVSPDGTKIASGDYRGSVHIWTAY